MGIVVYLKRGMFSIFNGMTVKYDFALKSGIYIGNIGQRSPEQYVLSSIEQKMLYLWHGFMCFMSLSEEMV